jgi:hypothetical protein
MALVFLFSRRSMFRRRTKRARHKKGNNKIANNNSAWHHSLARRIYKQQDPLSQPGIPGKEEELRCLLKCKIVIENIKKWTGCERVMLMKVFGRGDSISRLHFAAGVTEGHVFAAR